MRRDIFSRTKYMNYGLPVKTYKQGHDKAKRQFCLNKYLSVGCTVVFSFSAIKLHKFSIKNNIIRNIAMADNIFCQIYSFYKFFCRQK